MELWDVYNIDREKAGKVIDRHSFEILQNGEYHLVAEAIIINSKQEILMSKRAASKTKYPLMWECNGGSVKSGEDTLQAILRELKEELGIKLNKDEAIFYKTIRDDKAKDFKDIWIFRKNIDLKELLFTDNEVIEAKWVSIKEFEKMRKNNDIVPTIDFDEKELKNIINKGGINMLHKMKLNEDPFERMKNGAKTIEFRLYDEKRKQIKVGDQIEFSKLPDLQEKLLVDVVELYREDTFEKLFRKLFTDEEEIKRKTKSIYEIYSPEKEQQYGALGIKILVITNSFRYTYNKLVRDKIPEEIDSELGRKSKYRILSDDEYLIELDKKVLEEANEFIEENSIEELGDLMEVINAIMKLKGYTMEEVYKVMNDKVGRKGAFNKRIYLEYVDEEKRNLEEEQELNKEFRK